MSIGFASLCGLPPFPSPSLTFHAPGAILPGSDIVFPHGPCCPDIRGGDVMSLERGSDLGKGRLGRVAGRWNNQRARHRASQSRGWPVFPTIDTSCSDPASGWRVAPVLARVRVFCPRPTSLSPVTRPEHPSLLPCDNVSDCYRHPDPGARITGGRVRRCATSTLRPHTFGRRSHPA